VAHRYFTLDQANSLVPQLAGIMRQILQLHWHLRPLTEQLSRSGVRVTGALLAGGDPDSDDPGVLRLVAHAQALYDTIRDSVTAIEGLGAEIKDLEEGLIDFHSLRDGTKEVVLCWRMGENAITHYHELDAGFSGRRPVQGHDFVADPLS
jgi:hypothetical protein